ncbi:hypothetical protein PR048_024672 [Dryococelus australis]|uniref:Uncharacterized protein n=1 Tax=Dryococelus australis TaxID=614101 RepID=A0ABQ9GP92_9NEOP|nr:hypothetical protein PR048_024672 [Dryococelus australis]
MSPDGHSLGVRAVVERLWNYASLVTLCPSRLPMRFDSEFRTVVSLLPGNVLPRAESRPASVNDRGGRRVMLRADFGPKPEAVVRRRNVPSQELGSRRKRRLATVFWGLGFNIQRHLGIQKQATKFATIQYGGGCSACDDASRTVRGVNPGDARKLTKGNMTLDRRVASGRILSCCPTQAAYRMPNPYAKHEGIKYVHVRNSLALSIYYRVTYRARWRSGNSLDSHSEGQVFDPRSGFPWLSEFPPGECWDVSLTKAIADSFPIIPQSLFPVQLAQSLMILAVEMRVPTPVFYGLVVRLLASYLGEPGSIPGGIAPESSHVRIAPDDAAVRQVFSGISRFPRPFIPALLRANLISPSSALKISMVKSRPNLFTHSLTLLTFEINFKEIFYRRLSFDLFYFYSPSVNKGFGHAATGGAHAHLDPAGPAAAQPASTPGFYKVRAQCLSSHYYPADMLTCSLPPAGITPRDVNKLFRIQSGASVAERLARSPPTMVNRVQSPAESLPNFRMWGILLDGGESCWTMPLVGEFPRGSPVSPALSFRRCSILTSITLIGSQDLAVKSRPNLFTHTQQYSSGAK